MADNLPTTMSPVPPEDYDSDIKAIEHELADIDNLYDESLKFLRSVQASHSRGSLSFTHLQTSNLISLKNAKLSALKARVDLKNKRFNQNLKIETLTKGTDEKDIPVNKILEVLAMSGMTYQQIQERKASFVEAEEIKDAELEEFVQQELAADGIDVSTAENEKKDFKPGTYQEPIAEDPDAELEKCVEEIEFVPKTEIYEVVCDSNGKIYVIDLTNSSDDENISLLNPEAIGILPSEIATIETSPSGYPVAKFRDKEIEIVEMQ